MVDSGRRIQRYAWINCGYMHCVSLLRLGIFTEFLREGGLGPRGPAAYALVLMCSLPYVSTELGKRGLVADTALWARIALSLSVV